MFLETSFRGKPSWGIADGMEMVESGLGASFWVLTVVVSTEEAKGIPHNQTWLRVCLLSAEKGALFSDLLEWPKG